LNKAEVTEWMSDEKNNTTFNTCSNLKCKINNCKCHNHCYIIIKSIVCLILKFDLFFNRNKRSTIDVIKSLLAAADGNFPIYGEQEQLQNVLIQAIHHGNSGLYLIVISFQ
jgi:hypothetical protein